MTTTTGAEPTTAELVERLTAWRTIRRECPPDSHKAILADALLADFADRLVGLGVAK